MRVALLGPVAAFADDGSTLDLGGVRLRMLLARLALEAGRPVSVDTLIDGLWGEHPPAEAAGALQALVSRLRKAIRGAGTLELGPGGYRLSVRPEDVDTHRFETAAAEGRRELAAGKVEAAAATLADALALWRGPALADVRDAPFADLSVARLEELKAAVAEDNYDVELRLGRHAEVLTDLEAAAAERPLAERLAGLRMRALSAAGRQSDALAVYEQIRERLGDELGVDPSAELRDIHLALLRGELDRPAPRPEPTASRIPLPLTNFVGRDRELSRVSELLAAGRLVTLVGPGGAGKTRLAVETVSRHRAYERGRVWLVPLAGVSTVEQLTDTVLGALASWDMRVSDNRQPLTGIDRIAELLDVGPAVLVLDNCEHLIESAAELADGLLERLPQLRILATSREPLAIAGETLYQLGPLELPGEAAESADAADAPAVRLFLDRAVAARPDFVLDAETAGPVVDICRQLDGLPLALELAAAKLRSMSVEQIARRLDDRFRLLTSGSRTALPRQRTLLALVAWSWDLLTEPERVLARRLSLFPGGATLDALETICADAALPAEDVLYVADALVEKSVLSVSGDRYRMLATIRAYAADRLAESGDDLADRFVEHHLALVERYEPLLRTREQLRAIGIFDAEHENLVTALRSTLDEGDAVRAARFVGGLFWYWGIRGMGTQFDTFLAAVLRLDDALPVRERSALRLVQLLAGAPVAEEVPVRTLVEDCVAADALDFHPALLLWIPLLAASVGADDLGDRVLDQALTNRDPWVRASAHWARDYVWTERGDRAAGAEARAAAVRGFEDVGDRWGLGMALLAVGRDHSLRGEHARAIAVFERGVAVSSELGGQDDLFHCRARLTVERMRAGDLVGALRDIEAMRRQATARGHRRSAAETLFELAEWHRRAGDVAAADHTIDELAGIADRLGLPETMAAGLIAAARLANRLAEGDSAGARAHLPHAAAGLFSLGDTANTAHVAELLAELLSLEDAPELAAEALGLSEALRGDFDAGEPRLADLVNTLTNQLGQEAYKAAYHRTATLPAPEALTRLRTAVGLTDQ
ncbi:BTAD domain-containing putative transcriptional regulator [Nocardia amikacinitolerans]|uniref:BTAD domain-containing putative transcriptional regulator n=1 Tax=Nocardia amikacinitolerans TaxID=756689 RepID=UPI00368E46C6